MSIYVFVLFLLAVLTVKSDQPVVEMDSKNVNDNTKMILICRAKGFNTSGFILNIKKNRGDLLTKEDGVRSSVVRQPADNTYWRRDSIKISKSELSKYSCEVIHAESRFHVEKVWDPDSGLKGCSISSPPHVFVSVDDKEQANITLTCQAKDFYPRDITVNIKRNGIILTREDGVESSGVCLSKNNTFQRTDSIVISKSDVSNYSCEVVHVASGYHEEKVWARRLPAEEKPGDSWDIPAIAAAAIVVLVLVLILVLAVVLVLNRKHILDKDDTSDNDETEKFLKTNVQDQSTPSEPSDSSTSDQETETRSLNEVKPVCSLENR